MNYKQLTDLFYQHEGGAPEHHLTAYITFSSFGPENTKEYSWEARTTSFPATTRRSSPIRADTPSSGAVWTAPMIAFIWIVS